MIAMVLAHAVLQDKRQLSTILLLDDVAAHLDPARRAELFHYVLIYQVKYCMVALTHMPSQRFVRRRNLSIFHMASCFNKMTVRK